MKMPLLKDLKLKDIIYQKAELKIMLSLMENTFITKQLIQI